MNTKKWVKLEEERAEEWALGLETKLKNGEECVFSAACGFFPAVPGAWDPLSMRC